LNKGFDELKAAVNGVCILFVILAAINLVSGIIQVVGFSISGERQAQRIRHRYVSAILRWYR
jgi:hypothetical protein